MRRRLALLGAALFVACGGEAKAPGRAELETVEVSGAIDAGISLADDVAARPVGERVAGVVPSGFPDDFPVYSPASVVDFGPGFVELTSTDPLARVRQRLGAAAQAAGWRSETAGYRKGDRQIGVRLGQLSGLTTIRLDY